MDNVGQAFSESQEAPSPIPAIPTTESKTDPTQSSQGTASIPLPARRSSTPDVASGGARRPLPARGGSNSTTTTTTTTSTTDHSTSLSGIQYSPAQVLRQRLVPSHGASIGAAQRSLVDQLFAALENEPRQAVATEHGPTPEIPDDWATPEEVLRMRDSFQELVGQYQTEVRSLARELDKVRRERDAYATEINDVRQLQCAYRDGERLHATIEKQEKQWVEEREILRLQLQKLMIDNQRLKLSLEKRARSSASYNRRGPTSASAGATTSLRTHTVSQSGENDFNNPQCRRAASIRSATYMTTGNGHSSDYEENIRSGPTSAGGIDTQDCTLPQQESAQSQAPGGGSSLITPSTANSSSADSVRPLGLRGVSAPHGNAFATGQPGEYLTLRRSSHVYAVGDPSMAYERADDSVAPPATQDCETSSHPVYARGASLTTATTSSGPSLWPPRGAGLPPPFGGSTTTPGVSDSNNTVNSIPYLYTIPRTPAEALQEQLQLLDALHKLTRRYEELEGYFRHAEALWSQTATKQEFRLLAVARENERLKSDVRHWKGECEDMQGRLSIISAQLDDYRKEEREFPGTGKRVDGTSSSRMQEALISETREHNADLTRQYTEDQARLREEMRVALAAAESTQEELQHAMAAQQAAADDERGVLLGDVHRLENELGEAKRDHRRVVYEKDEALREATQRIRLLEQEAAAREDVIRQKGAISLELRTQTDQLQDALVQMQAHIDTRENCVKDLQLKLEQACQQLQIAAGMENSMTVWKSRAASVEEEMESQRHYYEKEIRVCKTAMEALQSTHRQELAAHATEYAKLDSRYQRARLRLEAVARGGLGLWDGRGTKKPKSCVETHLHNKDGDETIEADTDIERAINLPCVVSAADSPIVVCDPLEILRDSARVAAKLAQSIHRVA